MLLHRAPLLLVLVLSCCIKGCQAVLPPCQWLTYNYTALQGTVVLGSVAGEGDFSVAICAELGKASPCAASPGGAGSVCYVDLDGVATSLGDFATSVAQGTLSGTGGFLMSSSTPCPAQPGTSFSTQLLLQCGTATALYISPLEAELPCQRFMTYVHPNACVKPLHPDIPCAWTSPDNIAYDLSPLRSRISNLVFQDEEKNTYEMNVCDTIVGVPSCSNYDIYAGLCFTNASSSVTLDVGEWGASALPTNFTYIDPDDPTIGVQVTTTGGLNCPTSIGPSPTMTATSYIQFVCATEEGELTVDIDVDQCKFTWILPTSHGCPLSSKRNSAVELQR